MWRLLRLFSMELCFNQKKKQKTKQKRECVTFVFDPLVKSLNSKRRMLHYRLHCSCFILFFSVHTFLFMFHYYFLQSTFPCSCFIVISFSSHFIVYVSLLFPSVHSASHSPTIFPLFGCIHITWSFNLMVSFTFQPIPSMEINDLPMSLDKFLILDKYSLLETGLWWFYYSLSLCVKQEI